MLGVNNINNLTECSKILPNRVTSFTPADQSLLNTWLQTTGKVDAITNALLNGDLLTSLSSIITGLVNGVLRRAQR